jgi:hypothetical protein
MNMQHSDENDQMQTNCYVSSKFNFTVGAFAIAAALLIGYVMYVAWWK